jgi:hypothetical protein
VAALPVTRIAAPEWAPHYARGTIKRYDGFTDEDFHAIGQHRESILALLHTTVTSYLRDMAQEHVFPRRDLLTGEYYIGSEAYARVNDDDYPYPIYRMNFRVRCLQKPQPHLPRPDDYLGLDVCIQVDCADWQLRVYATDSSVI